MMRPLLPTADKIAPYLKRIDESRYYSNFGPLNDEYQNRLEELFGAPCITGSSATSLITAALMAYDLPRMACIAMPSWTFPATASAAKSLGSNIYFLDVDSIGVVNFSGMNYKPDVLIVVSPFGAPLQIAYWDKFSEDNKIKVIIDAAAGFDAFSTLCKPGNVPVIISTHATKTFGTGEGGFIACHDKSLLEKIRRITNFGLTPDRRIEYTGLNAKFSEYHAAVGLASLDEWPKKRKKLLDAVKPYGLDYAVMQVPVRISDYPDAKMRTYGCHIHAAYENCQRTALPVTEKLIENIGTVMAGIE